jgi:hypothetical protein
MGDRSELRAEDAFFMATYYAVLAPARKPRGRTPASAISAPSHCAVLLGIAWPAFDRAKVDP